MGERNESLNDGVLTYGKKKTQLSANKKIIGYALSEDGSLYFKELSARDQDYELAKASDKKLELKVKTLYPPSLMRKNKSDLLIVIDDVEYEVFKVDSDENKRFLFWYLSKMSKVDKKVVGVGNED